MAEFTNNQVKLDVLKQRAYNMRWAEVEEGVIPLTAADPDFPAPKAIDDALISYIQGGYFSYIVSQAYATTGSPNDNTYNSVAYLDQILEGYIEHFNGVLTEEEVTNRLIVTENLEAADFALKGGYKFYDRNQMLLDGVPSLVGFAMWEPVNGYMKGGMGAYQFGYEATNTPSYKWMRTAIQTMNPAIN